MKEAMLLCAHRWTDVERRLYYDLSEAVCAHRDLWIVLHWGTEPLPEELDGAQSGNGKNIFVVTDADISSIGFPTLRGAMFPGSSHFPMILFTRNRPEYQRFWIVEYDVVYTGRWSSFFAQWDESTADLLTSHIRHYHSESKWHWWIGSKTPGIPLAAKIRSFNPFYRISRVAVDHVEHFHRSGWQCHYELLMPTALLMHGFQIEDFGGDGPFVRPENRNRHYTDFLTRPDGQGPGGTFRWRPTFRRRVFRRNRLYHPVKGTRGLARSLVLASLECSRLGLHTIARRFRNRFFPRASRELGS